MVAGASWTGGEHQPQSRRVKFIQYKFSGNEFFVTAKYQRPIELIGSGGYGVVCSASNSETNERVAIKKIPNAFRDKIEAKATLREVKLLRHLNHENIIKLKDVMPPPTRETMEDLYIVFELMYTDLDQIIFSTKRLNNDHCKFFLYHILRGLKYMHSANVVHRDLKPSNILVNKYYELKICDFGHARVAPESNFMNECVVTLWYRSPELLLGSRYTAAIDMWSVGCIFMEMMNRKPLFDGEDNAHQLRKILEVMGTPTEAEMEFLSEPAKDLMRQVPKHPRRSLSAEVRNADPLAIDLAEKMLTFNPRQRITAEDALAHPYLSSVSGIWDEPVCATPLRFNFEEQELNEEEMKELVYQEALAFNPEFRH